MTQQETKKIIAVLMVSYPNYKPASIDLVVDVWADMLKDYTYAEVNAALKTYILTDTSGFAPSIGQIIEKMQIFKESNELNEMEAWQLVLKAMKNSIYHSEEEFAKLPPLVQKVVVSPGQLREWAMSEDIDGTWMNVTQSNFIRTYRMELSRKKEISKLSPDLQKLVSRTTEQVFVKQNETKSISASEEMRLLEQNAVPMPEQFKSIYTELMSKAI